MSDRVRINEQIRAKEIRLIDDATGKQLGIVSPRDALNLARERNLDLVEVAPHANPPVCRIMDYGKFMYERTKKEREAKKGQKVIEVKEMRIRPKTAKYHIGFKLNRVRDFLGKGNKVKIRIIFRAREITHATLARETFEDIAADLADIATVEQAPLMDGRSMVLLLAPGPQKGGATAARAAVRSAKVRVPRLEVPEAVVGAEVETEAQVETGTATETEV